MQEIWRDVNLYGKVYFVSNMGHVKSACRNKILKPYLSSGGYQYILVRDEGHHHHIRVHRLVADTFVPNPYDYSCVNHIDGDKSNNRASNLEWCSYSQNIRHGFKNGLFKARQPQKRPINQYDLDGSLIKTWGSLRDVEKTFNVSHSAIRFCCLGKIKTCKGFIWRYADE